MIDNFVANDLSPEGSCYFSETTTLSKRTSENESYTSVSMVRLLLKEYPDGAKVMDDNGDLPLHILLSRNHGDGRGKSKTRNPL